MKVKLFLLTFLLLSAVSLYSQSSQTYLIIATHTTQECMASMDELKNKGDAFLSNVYWGCKTGDHTAYVIVEAESEAAARTQLPANERDKAKVIPVNKFTVEQIETMHKEHEHK